MTPETRRPDWVRLSAILDEALDLAPGELPAFLDRSCGGDKDLRAHVERLLAADREAGDFLASPSLDLDAALEEVPGSFREDLEAGERIGVYRIVREIGRGGMGTVYLAERADGQFEHRVAIKIGRSGPGSDAFRLRFARERQILARLQHANIARLLDGGVTAGGLPYFVMEYVEGVPITRHCEENAVPEREILGLMIQACRAVAYAHRNLVVHRDLKPGNILVSGNGEVKLLDFGIAKPLSPDADADATLVQILTPHYAAPEQIRGEPATTATDVYSLGVVLFQLMTGRRPHGDTERSAAAVSRAVLEETPRAPSLVLREQGTAPPAGRPRAESGASPPPGRASRELDTIVLKALRKEPEERYSSAEAFLEDIERYLAGEPVRARPATFRYVAGKFVRRNRVPVMAGAAAILALIAGLVGTAWQARIASRERDRARLEAEKATRIKDFALGLFAYSDPYASHGPEVTARQMLDEGVAWAGSELAGEPEVLVELLGVMATAYKNLALFAAAESVSVQALRIARDHFPPDHDLVVSSLRGLGTVYLEAGDYDRALPPLQEGLALRLGRTGERDPLAANLITDLAVTRARRGEMAEADSLYRKALVVDLEILGPADIHVADDLNNLGLHLNAMNRYEEALAYFDRALAIWRSRGEERVETGNIYGGMAKAYDHLGPPARAESLWAEELRVRRKFLPPDHIDIALSLENMGASIEATGDYERAAALFDEALAIRGKTEGLEHPDMARAYNNVAIVYYRMGRYGDAADRFSQALASFTLTLGPDHPGTLTCRNNLAVMLRTSGRYEEAEREFLATLDARRRVLGSGHADVAGSLHHLGLLYRATGRGEAAKQALEQALEIRRKGEDAPRRIETLIAYGDVCRDRRAGELSLALLGEARSLCDSLYAAPSPRTADVLVATGRTLLALGRHGEAEPLLREGLRLRQSFLAAGHPQVGEAEAALGCCLAVRRAPEARELLTRGVAVLAELPPTADPLLRESRGALAGLTPSR